MLHTLTELEDERIPLFKILILIFRALIVSDNLYTIPRNGIEELIVKESIINFKNSVEAFASNKVSLDITTKEIDQQVVSSSTSYLMHSDIQDILNKEAPRNSYDSILVISNAEPFTLGITSIYLFSPPNLYGYASVKITSEDKTKLLNENGANVKYPYLVTTNVMIHEWMHQLESFRTYLNIIYPFTHAYFDNFEETPTEDWQKKENYSWDTNYFDDKTKYPLIVEDKFTSYYRAVLAGEVLYKSDNQYVGMDSNLWKSNPTNLALSIRKVNIVNLVLNKVMSYQKVDNKNTLTLDNVSDKSKTSNIFLVSSYINGYYTISPIDNQDIFLDLANDWDMDDNTIGLSGWTGYLTAQTYILTSIDSSNDNIVNIAPLKNKKRLLSYYNNSFRIANQDDSKNQKWLLDDIA